MRRLLADLDGRVATVLITGALVLLCLEYLVIRPLFYIPSPRPFAPMARWAILSFAAYFIVPALIVTLGFKQKLSDFGLTFKGVGRHLPLYLLLYGLMVPFIWFASRQPAFLRTYPFTADAGRSLPLFLEWEAVYGLQFLGLEFFFRGFLIFGLEKKFGANAIFVMVVPYCMLHFHKPMLEATAAIGAGLILGILAYRTRSIIGGVLIHFAVAMTMDVLAIAQLRPHY